MDMRTGKLSDEDYQAIDGALRAEAVQILERLDARSRTRTPYAPRRPPATSPRVGTLRPIPRDERLRSAL